MKARTVDDTSFKHILQIADTDFVVCDVETTGLHPERNRLTEIALLRIRGNAIVDRYSSLINPRQFIPEEVQRLTGITNEMVYTAPDAIQVMPDVRRFIGDAVFIGHNVRFDRAFVDATLHRCGIEALQVPNLCTARLARRLMPQKSRASLGALAAHYNIRIKNRHRAMGDAEATATVFLKFLQILDEEFDIHETGELISFQNRQIYRITGAPKYFTRLQENLAELPHRPGVYFFHDKRGDVLYIGKARDLKERVSSYFYHNIGHTEKIRRLVRGVHGITWKPLETELSALLNESRLIKQHQPPYNTQLKRYRKYPFIRIDATNDWPTIGWCYDLVDDGAEYFGPFRSRFAVEDALDSINKLFMLRECDGSIKPSPSAVPCLYHDIKRCGAPCAQLMSSEDYQREVDDIVLFLQGEQDGVLDRLRARMHRRAEDLDFEGAAVLRDRLSGVERIIRQQQLMVHSVRKQNLILVTYARRSNVEIHFIKSGMLAAQLLVDQRNVPERELFTQIEDVYFSRQEELFMGGKEDIDEMRIIASWCLTRRDESVVLEVEGCTSAAEAMELLKGTIEEMSNGAAASNDGAVGA
ncbi:MAG: DEDD exonuclease domain-containing protein [Bacteroidetes bacterium]|nr:DEDD exonuclease domain-containing protein [Bacteroidota bacterium]